MQKETPKQARLCIIRIHCTLTGNTKNPSQEIKGTKQKRRNTEEQRRQTNKGQTHDVMTAGRAQEDTGTKTIDKPEHTV